MPTLSLLRLIFTELWARGSGLRVPEPVQAMEDEAQTRAFAEVASGQSELAASHLFHAIHITRTIRGCGKVYDLACGPGRALGRVAELNPHIHFVGVDLSDNMLKLAWEHVQEKGLKNVQFLKSDITELKEIESGSADGVISTMALHHLPTCEHLGRLFRQIERILKPEGSVFLVDFLRLKTEKSIELLLARQKGMLPEVFEKDYVNSLRAAFSLQDFTTLTAENLPRAKVVSSFPLRLMVMVKTASGPLSAESRALVEARVRAQSALERKAFRDLQMIFFGRI
ncbi:MAG: hypothetical protein A2428_01430 [Bdellovibrionales bacterium RIFOXYC1_FULL_54_43]|nr:MAG: hypothetical protein A2428_01430 [Bdellovibrionales bacterium RIFOXYC1_FULL_54_43]OFZ78939.1 MAG: hypothetical protein A2603_14655 [Bdellovibrionales bacterium RIFOXYD1_FULL_55_31]